MARDMTKVRWPQLEMGKVSENFGHNKKSARNIVMWFNQ
jgi:hypothetical protein